MAGFDAGRACGLTRGRSIAELPSMAAKKTLLLPVALLTISTALPSCGLIGALGRSTNKIMSQSIDDESRGGMFESLREIDREIETLNRSAADSTP